MITPWRRGREIWVTVRVQRTGGRALAGPWGVAQGKLPGAVGRLQQQRNGSPGSTRPTSHTSGPAAQTRGPGNPCGGRAARRGFSKAENQDTSVPTLAESKICYMAPCSVRHTVSVAGLQQPLQPQSAFEMFTWCRTSHASAQHRHWRPQQPARAGVPPPCRRRQQL
jgi:hypothetical protein